MTLACACKLAHVVANNHGYEDYCQLLPVECELVRYDHNIVVLCNVRLELWIAIRKFNSAECLTC